MREHHVRLKMPGRFGAPKEAHRTVRCRAHNVICRREPVFVTVITASTMFSAIDSTQMDRWPSTFTTRPSTAMKKLHCRIERTPARGTNLMRVRQARNLGIRDQGIGSHKQLFLHWNGGFS